MRNLLDSHISHFQTLCSIHIKLDIFLFDLQKNVAEIMENWSEFEHLLKRDMKSNSLTSNEEDQR